MAVFTPVALSELRLWLRERGAGEALECSPIGEGIENTNYRVTVLPPGGGAAGEFVFTIFELWKMPQTEYYAALMSHLAGCGLPVPAPVLPAEEWGGDSCGEGDSCDGGVSPPQPPPSELGGG